MTEEWQETFLTTAGRWAAVIAILVVLVLLSVVPLRIGSLGEIRPAFALMAIYYWTILRPPPIVAVFALGLFLDLLCQYPLGMQGLVFVAVQALTAHQRRFLSGQSFLVIWAGFALVALGAGLIEWGVFSLFNTTLAALKPMLISTVLTAALFPAVVLPLAATHRLLTGQPGDAP